MLFSHFLLGNSRWVPGLIVDPDSSYMRSMMHSLELYLHISKVIYFSDVAYDVKGSAGIKQCCYNLTMLFVWFIV